MSDKEKRIFALKQMAVNPTLLKTLKERKKRYCGGGCSLLKACDNCWNQITEK